MIPLERVGETYTVMTYNIRVGISTSLAEIAAAIRAIGVPDVLALQEVGLRWRMGESVNQAAVIGAAIGLPYHAFAGALLDAPSGGRFGVALVSRYPLDGVHTLNLPRETDEQRIVLRARVAAPTPFVVLNSHLSVALPERLAQAQQLAMMAAAEREPLVVLGDFNDRPGTPTINTIMTDLTDCFDAAGAGPPETFSVADPHRRIDYIGVGNGACPGDLARVERTARASDHFPLWARVLMPA